MAEEEQNEEVQTEEPTPQVMTESVVDQARKVAERIERANAKTMELLNRQEALAVERTLGGKTVVQQEKPKEETPEEYARRVLNGKV